MSGDLFENYVAKVPENSRLLAVQDGKALIETEGGTRELPADTVILAVGFRPAPSLK